MAELAGIPMVQDPTRSQSESIETVVARMKRGRLVIPDYQRDAEQWDLRKESLFIESILNNLTIPAFFFHERDDQTIEVVDGQQRLTTILKFARNGFAISDAEDVVYLTPQAAHYRGKDFDALHERLKNVFNDYPLTIIYLPKSLALSAKLEIFRRINEGGTPLTSQDIRLAYYSTSPSVSIIRLAGIHASTDASTRMLKHASDKGVANPWTSNGAAWRLWCDWWEGKAKAKGQTPSEMFLWYLVARNRRLLDSLVSNGDSMKHLQLTFRGTTEEALDVYCAQLQYTDIEGGAEVLPTAETGLLDDFAPFASWIESILSFGLTGISVDKYKQMALVIAAAVELQLDPNHLTHATWNAIGEFIATPRRSGTKWLKDGYPEQKGRWGGGKGQFAQCEKAVELLQAIVAKHQ